MSKKRRWEAPSVDMQLVEIYEDLSSESSDVRLKAAQRLLSKLDSKDADAQEQLEKAINRLIRGLCSGRKSARLGFSVALTEVLAQHAHNQSVDRHCPSIHIPTFTKKLQDMTQITGSVAGQEERDHYLGKLFGTEALIKSKILFTRETNENDWEAAVDIILEIAKKKVWLREECGWILFQSLKILDQLSTGARLVKLLINKVNKQGLSKTPEGVALWIACRKYFPDVKLPKNVFRHRDPLHKDEKSNLPYILMESFPIKDSDDDTEDGQEKSLQKGSWSPKLHFAWEFVFGCLHNPDESQVTFQDLWTQAVELGLFAESASTERKYLGFLLIIRCFSELTPELLPEIFQRNFGRCLINNLLSKERYLHAIANASLEAMIRRAKEDRASAVVVVKGIIFTGIAFDVRLQVKPLEKILREAEIPAFAGIVSQLLELKRKTVLAKDRKDQLSVSLTVADLLVHSVGSRGYPVHENESLSRYRDIISSILDDLVQQGYGEVDDSQGSNQKFRSRITSCLAATIRKDIVDPTFHPYHVLCTIRSIQHTAPDADAEITATLERGWKNLQKIQSKEEDTSKPKSIRAIKLLFIFAFLQVYDGDADAVGIIEELGDCYESLVGRKSQQNNVSGGEALVQILLSFISKPAAVFRQVGMQVISGCSDAIDEEAVMAMIAVLVAKENSTGLDSLFDKDKDLVEEEEEEEEGDSDVQEVSDIDMESDESESDDSSSDSQSDESAVDGVDENYAELDAKLGELLGTGKDDDEVSDEDLDDEAMEALEPQLIAVFKQHKLASDKETTKKKERKDDKETMVRFKYRVLEMLEPVIKKETYRTHILLVVEPLIGLINDTNNKQISQQALKLVKTFREFYKLSLPKEPMDSSAVDLGHALLKRSHSLAFKDGSHAYWTACSQASLLAVKVILVNGGDITAIKAQYAATRDMSQEDSKSNLRAPLLDDFINWFTQAKKKWGYEGEAIENTKAIAP